MMYYLFIELLPLSKGQQVVHQCCRLDNYVHHLQISEVQLRSKYIFDTHTNHFVLYNKKITKDCSDEYMPF